MPTKRTPLAILATTGILAALASTACTDPALDLEGDEVAACDLDDLECDEEFRAVPPVVAETFKIVGKVALKAVLDETVIKMLFDDGVHQGPVELSNKALEDIRGIVGGEVEDAFYVHLQHGQTTTFETVFETLFSYNRASCLPGVPSQVCYAQNVSDMSDLLIDVTSINNSYNNINGAKRLQGSTQIQALGALEVQAMTEVLKLEELQGIYDSNYLTSEAADIATRTASVRSDFEELEQLFENYLHQTYPQNANGEISYCHDQYHGGTVCKAYRKICFTNENGHTQCSGMVDYVYCDNFPAYWNNEYYAAWDQCIADRNAAVTALDDQKLAQRNTNRPTKRDQILGPGFDESVDILRELTAKYTYYGTDVSASRQALTPAGSNQTQTCIPRGLEMRMAQSAGETTNTLVWQYDGNLVLYREGVGAVWESQTYGRGTHLCFQGDGNLVIYVSSGDLWASTTADNQHGGSGGQSLNLTAYGNLNITDANEKVLWETNTGVY